MTWSSHPAPDEHVEHVSRLPVSVAIYNYDDLVEITKADGSPLPGITDLLIIIT